MTVSPAPVLLRCSGIRKSFPGVVALDDVGVEVRAGSVHAVVGENGAGKSTLMKIFAGALQPDRGRIELDGRAVHIADARHARELGIAVVYQEFNLVNDLTIGENIFLGRMPRTRARLFVDFPELHRRARDVLASLGSPLDTAQVVRELSVAQCQMVEIAGALSQQARVLILDEPSAVLTPHELSALFAVVRRLTQRGTAVLYISHRLQEVFELADRVTVLRDGIHVSTRPVAEVNRGRLIADMVGRELKDEFPERRSAVGEVLLQVDGLTAVNGSCRDISFQVHSGEVFALTGLVGSGRSSVLKGIFGALAARADRLQVAAVRGPFANPRQAMAAGLAYLPEDRKKEGLLLERSVRENTTLAHLQACLRGPWLSRGRERATTARLMRELHIKTSGPESRTATLSGGNQQKVMLARWMDRPHRVILFDEPTRGIDVGAKYEIYTLINRLAADGVAVVMVSSELPEVIGMADRVAVMHRGRLTALLHNDRRDLDQQTIMEYAAGGVKREE